ncbi:MAG: SOUL family heme-binding protein [Halodesulfurarchaeum sp.]
MRTITKAGVVGAGLLAAWIGWGLHTRRSAERIPYESRETVDGVAIREYPETVVAETTARSQWIAFRRLFDYISGANEAREELAMTAPVRSNRGTAIEMTAPVRSTERGDEITMGFFLPPEYDPETAPRPTDGAVRLRTEPSRTVAAIEFSWYATDRRVEQYEKRLRSTLAAHGVTPTSEPSLLRYDDPWTPPFMRRNEVVVGVEHDGAN